ncbi:ATP:cob(I)alamin adenosyltransferase [Candidatus Kaiserbacteria bacterium RIFCSPHIGHO2_01_FULL_56_24]|uniref:Corrinoid adenosyltransferase n=1 Tax=Candidatus Kaiserbacteria bacterium RIFCSPHIGHO2_01_FULL_56_24 TaxID=1798487 RepID=A0A1F6DEA1_9BACT|nr:MAG: ATP:cob(I)alamin adenosyltransferase [Candidatus Kaiserbacteria bacterium RIFCSPHIGHO2_01_FULL_56_24]
MLYTGKGDNGTTKLFGCTERIAKDEPRVQSLGNIDELNSWLGFCAASAAEGGEDEIAQALRDIQNDLFVIQAILAGAPKVLGDGRVAYLETLIADVECEIEPIRSFTIPGTTVLGGALDVGRTIARRAERSIVSLRDETLQSGVIPYLNRLSSVLFALARLAAHRAGVKEEVPRY